MKLNALMLGFSALLICGNAASASVKVEDDTSSPDSSYSSVNKSIQIGDNAQVRDITSVNGSVRIGSASIVRNIESVNGGVKIESNASVESIEVVNGGIDLDIDVMVSGGVDSVNGRIRIDRGSSVGDSLHTVNGDIELTGTTVQGDVETYNGNIELSGSEVLGDLRVSKPSGWNWNSKKSKANRVVIGPDTVIHGNLYFEKPVKLSVHPSATIGDIIGDQVDRGDMR